MNKRTKVLIGLTLVLGGTAIYERVLLAAQVPAPGTPIPFTTGSFSGNATKASGTTVNLTMTINPTSWPYTATIGDGQGGSVQILQSAGGQPFFLRRDQQIP